MQWLAASNRIRRLPRYREVANIFIKHGFGFIFQRFSFGNRNIRLADQSKQASIPFRLRKAFEELGPTYVKLGQLLSTRPDLLPPAYIKEFERLQDDVAPLPLPVLLEVLQKEGIDLDRDFVSFNPQPIAAASIAQVHEGVLPSGQRVVIKVQRPGVDKTVESDLGIMMELAKLLEKRSSWGRLYRVSEVVEELGEALINELDFRKEAKNADIFYHNFKGDRHVQVPRVFWELSNRRVLTLEYLEGIKISDFSALRQAGYDHEKIAAHLVEALFKQVYEFGFFHADPHPGNIAVAPGEKIIFYDFGQVGAIDQFTREKAINMVIGMMRYDVNAVTRSMMSIALSNQHVNFDEIRHDVARLQQKYYGLPLSEINIAEALSELLELSVKHQMRLPAELSLMIKMLMTIESIAAQLDSRLSILDIAEPYGKKLLWQKYSPERLKTEILEVMLDYAEVSRKLPRDFHNVLKTLDEGEFRIKMEHHNLNRLTSRIDVSSNRLSLAIILASIIIGTALVVNQSGSKILTRIPLVQGGFVVGIILGLFLTYSILRSGRY